ncbi:VOC family protein [Sphingomonas daechungensis]|uniref:VOC family protein n=1 Tax=Sphingomonas daechungensis TaxID=1176646 RepID=A0ABX6T845_9SPHN|nr:VOC family protein [Sphingomonas daechungensis]QNP43848.1 VOC family protein [Sphingomonas daechungensis]
MIGYVTVGSNDLEKARGFYDALMPTLGAGRMLEFGDNFTMYGTGMGKPGFAVCKPFNGNSAECGNGNMTAIACDTRAKVDALYAKAMDLGATDEGAPGVRGEEGEQAFYGAYFRDLDGNKLCAFRIGPAD